ncbi:hypothetical protein BDR26DRAFT_952994 [Obelidium mucronatum]|nr:hypothetical protein BDR26DRAFT_952994 [Obelidium mucronatum]
MHAATQSSRCGSEHNAASETLAAMANDVAASNTMEPLSSNGKSCASPDAARVENSASAKEATTEEVGPPTIMDSPAVRRTPSATADIDDLQKEEQAIAISMAMRKKNTLVINRQEVSQNPNRSVSALVDAMMKQRAVVNIDERDGMAAAFKTVLCTPVPSTLARNSLLLQQHRQKRTFSGRSTLVKQYDEAFPPPKLLEDTPGKPAKKKQRKETAGSLKSASGPGPKQVVKNTIQLVKKIEAILNLSAFKDIAEAWESIKLEPSVGLKYNAILTQCTRQFNDICAGSYIGRCDGNQGRTSKHGTFGISLLLETCKWLTFYIADNAKKPSAIGTLDQLATFLRGVRKATRGQALSPLLTPQEVQKLNSQLQHDAEDAEVLEDDSDEGDDASEAKTGSKRKSHAKENLDRKRVHKTKEGDYIVPDEVIRLFAEQLNGNQLNVKIVKKDGIFVFDLTGEE